MCGIVAGVWARGAYPDAKAVERGAEQMAKRGPDGSGRWDAPGVSLGHRRLSVIDPVHRSDQPMHDPTGRYTIVFNGEIYNYSELRGRLISQGIEFSTRSDTEVVLALFARFGAGMLPMLRGMFALAIWDSARGELFVARDPYGIKPLYFAAAVGGTLVASQVKALMATRLVSSEPDAWGQATFWLNGSVSAPHTWFRDVSAFPAGSWAWIGPGGIGTVTRWYDIALPFRASDATSSKRLEPDAVREALADSVRAHLIADVPVGIFASGGIDSGAVAGLVRATGDRDIEAVTLHFREFVGDVLDESADAARVARHYGLHHHLRLVTSGDFAEDRDTILADMDQPTVDGVNTWYAAKAMREAGVKVALSGVGGDELFQGYPHFKRLGPLVNSYQRIARVPGAARTVAFVADRQGARTGNARWADLPYHLSSLTGAWLARRGLFAVSDLPQLMGRDLAEAALAQAEPVAWAKAQVSPLPSDPTAAISVLESKFYLGNQLLRDSDWASMAHGVELRTPLVDHRLLEAVAPYARQLRHYPQKQLLATAPPVPLPPEVVVRKKTGFAIPVAQWLAEGASGRHPTRAWAEVVAQGCYGA